MPDWEQFRACLAATTAQPPRPPAQPVADESAINRLRQAGTVIFTRLQDLLGTGLPASLSPAEMSELESICRAWRDLIAASDPANPALAEILALAGGAERLRAGFCLTSNRNQHALRAYSEAASYFTQAGDAKEASDCEARILKLRRSLTRSLDQAAAEPLTTLIQAGTVWQRIEALIRLCDVGHEAGDIFESAGRAEEAARNLKDLGYGDPGELGAESAMDTWIGTAAARFAGLDFLARISQVGMWYLSVLRSRHAVLLRRDAAQAAACETLIAQVSALLTRAQLESAADVPAPPSAQSFATFIDECREADNALAAIRLECNNRAGADSAMDDLISLLHTLQTWADKSDAPEYQAKIRLELAYVFLAQGLAEQVIPAAQACRTCLLAGNPPSLSALPHASQRYLYLRSLSYELKARMMSGNADSALTLAQSVIRDYESERYRVSGEYRQAAMLKEVAEIYKLAAFAAFQLKKWDDMLEAMDLIKSRAATRNRLIPDTPQGFADELTREFERLANMPEGESRRREIWDLLTIRRAADSPSLATPALRVASLQSALSEDEAVIAYFWISESVLLLTAVDRTRFLTERLVMKPGEPEAFHEFIGFIQHLEGTHKFDTQVAQLGEIFLPDALRDFIREKHRLVFSPHHSLHLFPFHAARWDDADFIGTKFAVRYAPNFSALLLPETGPAENRILAIGIGHFEDPSIRPLSTTERDVAEIRHAWESAGVPVETLLGKDATRERFLALRDSGALARFRCLHFGTHGVSVFENPDQPLESALRLQNGPLDAMDIANLRLHAELAVLCACHSGERALRLRDMDELPGDDIFGLQSALFKAGVASVLGSLWIVEEQSSSAILRSVHRHLADGVDSPEALRRAVKEYLSGAPARANGVYFWAPWFISSLANTRKGA